VLDRASFHLSLSFEPSSLGFFESKERKKMSAKKNENEKRGWSVQEFNFNLAFKWAQGQWLIPPLWKIIQEFLDARHKLQLSAHVLTHCVEEEMCNLVALSTCGIARSIRPLAATWADQLKDDTIIPNTKLKNDYFQFRQKFKGDPEMQVCGLLPNGNMFYIVEHINSGLGANVVLEPLAQVVFSWDPRWTSLGFMNLNKPLQLEPDVFLFFTCSSGDFKSKVIIIDVSGNGEIWSFMWNLGYLAGWSAGPVIMTLNRQIVWVTRFYGDNNKASLYFHGTTLKIYRDAQGQWQCVENPDAPTIFGKLEHHDNNANSLWGPTEVRSVDYFEAQGDLFLSWNFIGFDQESTNLSIIQIRIYDLSSSPLFKFLGIHQATLKHLLNEEDGNNSKLFLLPQGFLLVLPTQQTTYLLC
jgi:hypothetical protein